MSDRDQGENYVFPNVLLISFLFLNIVQIKHFGKSNSIQQRHVWNKYVFIKIIQIVLFEFKNCVSKHNT